MNRLQFLKTLFSLPLAAVCLPAGLLQNGSAQASQKEKKLLLLGTQIAGERFYRFYKIIENLRVGQKLVLRREPTNRYDRRAIEVFTERGEKLGYVPRRHNRVLSVLMDSGVRMEGVLAKTNGEMMGKGGLEIYANTRDLRSLS